MADRTAVVPGSIFDPLPAGGDLYLLASILHNWDDDQAGTILRRCAEAAGAHRRILVVDRTSDHGNPLTYTFMNLLMLVFLIPLWGVLPFLAPWTWVVLHITGTLTRVRGKDLGAALEILRVPSRLVPVQLTLTAWSAFVAATITAVSRGRAAEKPAEGVSVARTRSLNV